MQFHGSIGSASHLPVPQGTFVQNMEREMSTFHDQYLRMMRAIQNEKEQLLEEKAQLQRERQQFEEMKKKIEDINKMKSSKVKLNIGGTVFHSTVETLICEEESMLAAMFSGRFTIEYDEDGCCFIDRDPTYFNHIMNYLRNKREGNKIKNLGYDLDTADKVMKEAKFYGLDGLEKLIVSSTSLVVSTDNTSKYNSINAALKDAKNGERILVRPGAYFETITIDRPVEIEGDSDAGEVLLCYSGDHVVTSGGEKASIRNISIAQQGDEYHCLFVTKGNLLVENCSFKSCGWACIGISGEKTHPILRGNQITHSSDNGIIVLSKGKGLIEGNDIFGFTLQGIEVREESSPIIRNNRIHDGKDSGIYINTKGRGVIEGNEIYNNEFNGIAIKFEGQPKRVSGNKVYGNKQRGVFVSGDSKAEIIGNEVYGNLAGDIVEE